MSDLSPKFDALFIAPGTSLYYFSGIRWWPSERLLALLLPRAGDPILSAQPSKKAPRSSFASPPTSVSGRKTKAHKTRSQALADRGLRTGRIGIDETTDFTFSITSARPLSHSNVSPPIPSPSAAAGRQIAA